MGIKRSAMHSDSPAFSRPCYGYDRDEKKHLVINEREAEVLRTVFEWYGRGWSIVRIKRELDASRIPSPRGKRRWAFRTIRDILSNEKYAGASVYGKTVTVEYPATKRIRNSPDEIFISENHHPPIINRADFSRV